MADLSGGVGELSMEVQVIRKDTGKVENYTLTGVVNQEQFDRLVAEGVLPNNQGENHGS